MRRDKLPELLFRLDSPAPFDLYFTIEKTRIISSYESFDPDNEMYIRMETNMDPFPALCAAIIAKGVSPGPCKVRYYGKAKFISLISSYRHMKFKRPWYKKVIAFFIGGLK